jgi:hypothetical protein
VPDVPDGHGKQALENFFRSEGLDEWKFGELLFSRAKNKMVLKHVIDCCTWRVYYMVYKPFSGPAFCNHIAQTGLCKKHTYR